MAIVYQMKLDLRASLCSGMPELHLCSDRAEAGVYPHPPPPMGIFETYVCVFVLTCTIRFYVFAPYVLALYRFFGFYLENDASYEKITIY